MPLSSLKLTGRKSMVTKMTIKFLIVLFVILPVSAANTDDEIIKNLDFFQSMELLKNDVALSATVPAKEQNKTEKEETKSRAPEKK